MSGRRTDLSYSVRHIDYRISFLESYRSHSWTELDKWSVRKLRRNLLLLLLLLLLPLFVCACVCECVCDCVWGVYHVSIYRISILLFLQSIDVPFSVSNPIRFGTRTEPDWWMCRTVPFLPPELLLLLLLLSILLCTSTLFSCSPCIYSFIYIYLSQIPMFVHSYSSSFFFSFFLFLTLLVFLSYFSFQHWIENYTSIRNIGVRIMGTVDCYVIFSEESVWQRRESGRREVQKNRVLDRCPQHNSIMNTRCTVCMTPCFGLCA